MNITPELKAYKAYKKNVDIYCEQVLALYPDNDKLTEFYKEFAGKFGGDGVKLEAIIAMSYDRYLDRAFRPKKVYTSENIEYNI